MGGQLGGHLTQPAELSSLCLSAHYYFRNAAKTHRVDGLRYFLFPRRLMCLFHHVYVAAERAWYRPIRI